MTDENAEWRNYEQHIFDRLREWAGDQADVKFDQRVTGRFSEVPRQVDVLIANARVADEVGDDLTIDNLPYTPAHDEAYYEADYFDHSPQGPIGAIIRYRQPDNPEGYTVMPDELQWELETLASGVDDKLSWGDDEARKRCVRVVLRHYLNEEPSEEQVEMAAEELAHDWQDGYPWVLYVGELRSRLGW